MEELIIRRQISYSCVFPNGEDKLEDLLPAIPSRSAISWASYMLTKKKMMTIDQNETDFFIPLLFKMSTELSDKIIRYLQSISKELGNYNFIDEVTLLILIEHLLENHNDKDEDVFTSKVDFSNMIIAYLLCCDEKLSSSLKVLPKVNNTDDLIALYLPEQLRINDIYYPKDYRVEFIRFFYFMHFCEGDQTFKEYLNLFLQENNIHKWDDYLYFVFDTHSSMITNQEGCTNMVKIDAKFHYGKQYLDGMCIDIENFKRTADFTHIRSKPIYYHGNNTYSILSMGFFIDKMYQSFLFDFSSVLIKNYKTTKIIDYPTLKGKIGERFTEECLFYELVNGCFSKTCKKLFSGKELKKNLIDGEPDFYLRKGKNIFLFEFKDVLLNAKTKHCEDLEQIKSELLQLFESSTVDKNTGKSKKAPQPKGITQLLNVIESKLDIIIQKIDKIEVADRINVYPIIVYQDSCFGIEGVNCIISNRFDELKTSRKISDNYSVKKCVMMPFEMMISLEDYFNDGRLILENLINDFSIERSMSPQNELLPFNKFIMRRAWELGYHNEMSSRFKKVLDFMIEKNKSK